MTHSDKLQDLYDKALLAIGHDDMTNSLPDNLADDIEYIVSNSERNKGMLTVLITLLTHKSVNPSQDIRYHQAQLANGFAGRHIDTIHITPFMKSVKFPSMSESGWLTRSLEQPHPYDLNYPGKITPEKAKYAFLDAINEVQVNAASPDEALLYMFKLLIKQRDLLNIELAKPHSLPIASIIEVLVKHCSNHYSCSGASRLPSLAIYAAYECMMNQVRRFEGKTLLPLASHNSADASSGRIGDLDVVNSDGSAFEGVEIKHALIITPQMIRDAYEKFKIYNTERYYLLTTADMSSVAWGVLEEEESKILHIHGCQVITDNLFSTLSYYLRLLNDPAEFVDRYVELLKVDETVKYEHKVAWNEIIANL